MLQNLQLGRVVIIIRQFLRGDTIIVRFSYTMAHSLRCPVACGPHDGVLAHHALRHCKLPQPFRHRPERVGRSRGVVHAADDPQSSGNGSTEPDLNEDTLRRLEKAEAEAVELRKQLKLAQQMQASH